MPSYDKTIGSIKEKWPADKVERISVEKLIPYARNARTHSDAQVAQIAVDAQGRITAVANVTISGGGGGNVSANTAYAYTWFIC